MALVLLVVSAALLVYTYALYPLVLWIGAYFLRRPKACHSCAELPTVSVVVAAHNEEDIIAAKIRNTEGLDYPKDRFEFLVGSDGSTDRTDEICSASASVTFERIETRQGKTHVLNTLIPQARGEIIVLCDANTMIEPDAIAAMVRHFDDPTVGGVCGRLELIPHGEQLQDAERAYWSYESTVKALESRWYSTVGANGGVYAIRKALFAPIPDDTIIDDFAISMRLLQMGKRLVFEPAAVAHENVTRSFRDLFWRKVRIGAGNLQFVWRTKLAFAGSGFVNFAYVSRKLIRWFSPFLMIVMWLSNLALSTDHPFTLTFWTLNVTILLGLLGLTHLSSNRVLVALAYLYSLNLALLVGYGRYILGLQPVTWQRAER